MSIKDKLKQNEIIHYFGVCLRRARDSRFRNAVIEFNGSPSILLFRHFGDENPDKNIYLIYLNNHARGFFSQFNLLVDGLYFAKQYNLTPVVEYGPKTLYHEDDGLDGVYNSFEFYFNQPAGISASEARKSKNVVLFENTHRKLGIENFSYTLGYSLSDPDQMEKYMTTHAAVIKQYISFSNGIETYLEETVRPLFCDRRVLGVHIRGTDFSAGYNGHAVAISPQEYLEETKKAFVDGTFDKVFLATDEATVIDMYKDEFDSNLIYFSDTLHSEDGSPLHFSANKREHHKYLLGAEVLRDMYALSISDGLIAGFSNVSLAARLFKKSRDEDYTYLNLIDKGFYHGHKRMRTTQ